MKIQGRIFFIFYFLFFIFYLPACNINDKPVLPASSGKPGEIIVVIEKKHWDSRAGGFLKDCLAGQHIALPQPEPLFDLFNITHSSFTRILKLHSNIILIYIT